MEVVKTLTSFSVSFAGMSATNSVARGLIIVPTTNSSSNAKHSLIAGTSLPTTSASSILSLEVAE
eukprot:6310511-Lingulodinium_polyedra.AAC.1